MCVYQLFEVYIYLLFTYFNTGSTRDDFEKVIEKALNMNWRNQKPNPALRTKKGNQRTNGPVNAHLISGPSKSTKQNLETNMKGLDQQ